MNRLVTYTDPEGFKFQRLIPAHAPESEAFMGIEHGPPDTRLLDLPPAVQKRLNHQLFVRGLFTKADTMGRESEVVAAVIAAYKVDAVAVLGLYEH